MANLNPKRGLFAVPDSKGQINTKTIAISSSNTVPLFPGSAYYVSGGQALGLAAGAADNVDIAGSIVAIYTDAGCVVQNVLASTGGHYAEVTYEPSQRYVATFDATGYAYPGDVGKFYNLTDETATANANGMDGAGASGRQLEVSSEAASGKHMVVGGLVGAVGTNVNPTNNTSGADGSENAAVYCTINPVNHQSW